MMHGWAWSELTNTTPYPGPSALSKKPSDRNLSEGGLGHSNYQSSVRNGDDQNAIECHLTCLVRLSLSSSKYSLSIKWARLVFVTD
jgi:hypothetical protein